MKKILNVLLNSQLTINWKQIMVKENSGIDNCNLQTVPAYSTITPVAFDISRRRRTMPLLSVVVILLFVSVTFSSCFTSGYGCKGKSRIITRVR